MTLSAWDLRYLALAQHVSTWSKDPERKVGAVIVENNRVVSLGFNGLPRYVEDSLDRLMDVDTKLRMTVHAEKNAIIFAERSLHGCTLYVNPLMPCSICAGMIIQAGIVRVVSVLEPEKPVSAKWQEDFAWSKVMFKEAGVQLDLA